MQNLILFTKKYELTFDANGVSLVDVSGLVKELSNEYIFLDANPAIKIEGNFQYVTFKLCRKEERKKIGF